MGKDEDIKATDERVGSRKLVAAGVGGGSEGEVEETENFKAVVCFNVDDAVGNVGRRRADVETNTVDQRKMFGSIGSFC